ncbi:hypothetical protein E3N88_32442 [Mikania micrantha]|uniref:Uncharacterized protein n=1 Tax=Mikania micrantha TaxID=192012 RepID=A0A5N6M918_9ASTR|nr:hypothetical protein E3N88_32442 [Mikania micrantha]
MRQDFSDSFRWWYYDGRSAEAVIVWCKEDTWDTVRIFDPMWLTNLPLEDVKTLYRCHIFFDVGDMEQALQFMRVIRLCFTFDMHAGSNWKSLSEKFLKTGADKYYQPDIDAFTRIHKVILKWLPPNVMKKIPLQKMRQDFSDSFRWWYYDGRSAEAVIVWCKEDTWDTVRIFDPMLLTNLPLEDVKTLYRCHIFFDVGDMEQALQFMRVIRLCFTFDMHAGSNWKSLSEKFLKTGADK